MQLHAAKDAAVRTPAGWRRLRGRQGKLNAETGTSDQRKGGRFWRAEQGHFWRALKPR
jgi:hypothetical protein